VRTGDRASLEWYSFGDLTPTLLYEVLAFRQAIFVVEQRCAYPDLDGFDQRAQHLLLRVDGELGGCLRLIPFPDEARVKIGRVAVALSRRKQGFARVLMKEALARCGRDYPDYRVTLSGQTYLAPFYESLGFVVTSAPYDDYGLSHVDMALVPSLAVRERVDAGGSPRTGEGKQG
jgi:ElaA protein